MAPNYKGRLLPVVLAAAVYLGIGPGLAWQEIDGNWCSDKGGCGRWDSLFTVRIDGLRQISIFYRNTDIMFFQGAIKEPKVKWTIRGMIKGPDGDGSPPHKFEAILGDEREDRAGKERAEIEGIITGSFKGKIEGSQEKATLAFEGTTTGAIVRKAAQAGIEEKIAGTIRWKLTTSGSKDVEGSFEATLEKKVEGWRILGVYLPPPVVCSENGKIRSVDEEAQMKYRRTTPGFAYVMQEKKNSAGITERVAEVKARELLLRAAWRKEQQDLRLESGRAGKVEAEAEGLRRLEWEKKDREARLKADPGSTGRLEAVAREIEPRNEPDPERYGRFARIVVGTISAKKDKITLDLPTLPVLDGRCVVTSERPAEKLTLERQEPPER